MLGAYNNKNLTATVHFNEGEDFIELKEKFEAAAKRIWAGEGSKGKGDGK